jgi:hypothetical protein
MTDLEKFNQEWTEYYRFKKQRGEQTQKRYESIVFSIWKHHNDWDEDNGFQVKCLFKECPEYRTLYRVRNLPKKPDY